MSRRGYYPSGHPQQCKNLFVFRQSESNGQIAQKVECKRKAVWLIIDKKLRLCHICFERYLSVHQETDPANINRLSDNEQDFVEHFNEMGKGESVYQ